MSLAYGKNLGCETLQDALLLNRLSEIIDPKQIVTGGDEREAYSREPRDLFHGKARVIVRPGSVDEVAALVRFAQETGTPIVPQGGNTGLVGGQVPDDSGNEIILSLSRLKTIRDLDTASGTMVVEAGVVLAEVQRRAAEVGLLFPMSLGSEGSCQIGGNISSNAGGTAVLAYGNMRDLVLGLEVVLPSGDIWHGLRRLKKDNSGYDLKHLFIGAEGTLGIITAAVLKLFPAPNGRSVAYAGLQSPDEALSLFKLARSLAGANLTAFELMPDVGVDMVVRHVPGARKPLERSFPWYVLVEISSARNQADSDQTLEQILTDGLEEGLIEDAAIASNLQHMNEFWSMRHEMSDVQRREGGSIKHDVSVPVDRIPELLSRGIKAVTAVAPGIRPVPFGHLGDGNIHFNFSQPIGADKAAYLERWDEINEIVHGIVIELGGSIAAEHGIGRLKHHLMPEVRSAVELDLMRSIKRAVDPMGILSPGRVL